MPPSAPDPNPPGRATSHAIREQDAVWAKVLAMGTSVVSSVEKCVQAVCEGRLDVIAEVKEEEEEADRTDVMIEQECLRILALFEPVASDLRRMATVMKVNRDWERIADLALRVARRVRKLNRKFPGVETPDGLKDLSRLSLSHVRSALMALMERDSAGARSLIAADEVVDQAYRAVRKNLKERLAANPERLDAWLLLLNSARNLERIADHATGIAQTVVFLQEGTIIRHGGESGA